MLLWIATFWNMDRIWAGILLHKMSQNPAIGTFIPALLQLKTGHTECVLDINRPGLDIANSTTLASLSHSLTKSKVRHSLRRAKAFQEEINTRKQPQEECRGPDECMDANGRKNSSANWAAILGDSTLTITSRAIWGSARLPYILTGNCNIFCN